jgi:cytochrome c oxidase assembly protein subunit 15
MAVGFVALQAGGQVGSPAVRASVGGAATLVAIALSFLMIGRWVRMRPSTFHRIAVVSALLLAFIIVSGAAVRLTGSGLGCPTWPNCHDGSLTAEFGASGRHDDIEFLNRIVTGLCVLAAGIGVLGAVARRPYRRDLTQLGWVVVAFIMGNAVLGGLVVLFHLKPQIVMGHFLLAITSLAVGVVIVHRSREGEASSMTGRGRSPAIDVWAQALGRAMTICALIVVFLGTIVTGSGPHGGDPDVERFALSMRETTRWHSVAAWLLVALVLALAVRVRRTGWRTEAGREVVHRCGVLLAVIAAQGVIGYLQYANRVPAGLVMAHIVGAVSVWVAVLWVRAALTVPASVSPASRSARVRDDRLVGAGS